MHPNYYDVHESERGLFNDMDFKETMGLWDTLSVDEENGWMVGINNEGELAPCLPYDLIRSRPYVDAGFEIRGTLDEIIEFIVSHRPDGFFPVSWATLRMRYYGPPLEETFLEPWESIKDIRECIKDPNWRKLVGDLPPLPEHYLTD